MPINPEVEPEGGDECDEIAVSDMSDEDGGHDGGDSQALLGDIFADEPVPDDTYVDSVGDMDMALHENECPAAEPSEETIASTQLVPGEGDGNGGDDDDDVQCLSPPLSHAEELIAKRKGLEDKISELSAMLETAKNAKKIETARTPGILNINRIVCRIREQLVITCSS